VATLIIVAAGTWAAHEAERALGIKDPGAIVVDEVAGMAVSVLALPLTPGVLAGAFVLFRVFDVVKPYPANALQRLPGGPGVMIDDLVAGLYALGLLALARHLTGMP
jgi:phosphatidylglycerophosphatase A